MQTGPITRRSFLQATAAAGAALAASGTLFSAVAADAPEQKKQSIFVCSVCGHVEFGAAPDACPVCHAPKEKFIGNDELFSDHKTDAEYKELSEKHTPVVSISKKPGLIKEQPVWEVAVRVGAHLHPMEREHWIQWIDCYVDDRYISRIFLTPGSEPAAAFFPKANGSKIRVVEHCNLHGHWEHNAAA